jgi:hypothetical protein
LGRKQTNYQPLYQEVNALKNPPKQWVNIQCIKRFYDLGVEDGLLVGAGVVLPGFFSFWQLLPSFLQQASLPLHFLPPPAKATPLTSNTATAIVNSFFIKFFLIVIVYRKYFKSIAICKKHGC